MAWSDAARAAAAMARRAHAKGAKLHKGARPGRDAARIAGASHRNSLAGHLRAIRRGMHGTINPASMARAAAYSTAVRNSLRRRKK